MGLPSIRATRITSRIRRGSSSPVVALTEAGRFVIKLRGAAQGASALIAEIIVAELCDALKLPVPERVLVELDDQVPSDDKNDELADLLGRSRGTNLGFRWLEGAVDLLARDVAAVDEAVATSIVWLDGLVMNPDRTAHNSNLLVWHGGVWLIDHGACLAFQHDWAHVNEDDPRAPGPAVSEHLLASRVKSPRLVDEAATRMLSRDVLSRAVSRVPEAFFVSAFPEPDVERLRAAYVAFLWKRLKPPRPFWDQAASG
jgi:hypothetical protein